MMNNMLFKAIAITLLSSMLWACGAVETEDREENERTVIERDNDDRRDGKNDDRDDDDNRQERNQNDRDDERDDDRDDERKGKKDD